MDCRHRANRQQKDEQWESHEEHVQQECSGLGQRTEDDNTGAKRRRSIEPHEVGRRVLQKPSLSITSTSGIDGMGGVGERTETEDVHNHHQLPYPGFDTGPGSSSCPGPGLGSSVNTTRGMGNLAEIDVFLNHRGPDVKMTFVAHLDEALRRVGCTPFVDFKSLETGNHAFDSISEALTGAKVHVAILSSGYGESKYCLDELCDMLASKKPIIPVFYKVKPGDLRWLENKDGPFAKAFTHHMERGRNKDVAKWKGALTEVAAISGVMFADNDNEEKLVEKVVAAVFKALPAPPPIPPARHPVGLTQTSKAVVNMLHNMGDGVGVMGICGMGGIGKTTLAKEVYNQLQSEFQRRCFLEDVKDAKDVMALRMKMVINLFAKDGARLFVDYARGLEMVRKEKVLVVMDDISEAKQFYNLIPNLEQLAPGSRVIITSREGDILRTIMAVVPPTGRALYVVPELNALDSLELFLRCAFHKKSLNEVDDVFHDYAWKISKACGGVPLALEVIGGYLVDKRDEPQCWTEALLVLKNNPDIDTRLRFSYDRLQSDDEKRMFVDIACFMLGHPKDIALEVWNSIDYGSPRWYLLDRLVDKFLVKVNAEGDVEIHDLLRDMGRNIVRERAGGKPEMQSHIWDPAIAAKVLQRGRGSNEILAILLDGVKSPAMVCKSESFAKLKELRYLSLDKCKVNGDFSGWSEELRWLKWRHYPFGELPSSIKLPSLVVLDLANSSHLTHLWDKNFEIEFPWEELQVLILKNCRKLKELPQGINKLIKLKILDLQRCLSLRSLPDSLRELAELEHLNCFGCLHLSRLPNFSVCERIQNLGFEDSQSLKKFSEPAFSHGLQLSRRTPFTKLPLGICSLRKLTVLNMKLTSLNELPGDFGLLSNLKRAYFTGCKRLVELPESFGNMSNLEELWLDDCEALQRLAPTFSKLTKLQTLDMRGTALEELPSDYGLLSNLKRAYFTGCKRLVELPESFGNLSNLEELGLDDCEVLQGLPRTFSKLTKLHTLRMRGTALEELPGNFGLLCNLKTASFAGCKRLVEFPESFGNLSNLEELWLDDCEVLQRLPLTFSKLTKLQTLHMRGTALEELPGDFELLCNLKTASFAGCKRLVEFPESFGNLSNLEELWLDDCEVLQRLPPTFSKLTKLQTLHMRGTALEELPGDFGLLSNSKRAYFTGCKRLVELPESFGNMSKLEELWLDDCEVLQRLAPTFSKLTKLHTLGMQGTALDELPGEFGLLSNLTRAYFTGCTRLVELPESFGNLSNLEELWLDDCEVLQRLPPTFSKLTNLQTLDMRGTALEELPGDFGLLSNLKRAYFIGCKRLVELPESFGNMSKLKELWLDNCQVLQRLPPTFTKLTKLHTLGMQGTALDELPGEFGLLSNLKRAYFTGCTRLVELPESFGNLSNLEELWLDDCEVLQRLPPTFSNLTNLQTLDMRGTALTVLPCAFGLLSNLQKARFDGCPNLVQLSESFGNLSKLEELWLQNCEVLQRLPPTFSKLTKLQTLDMRGTSLEELPGDFALLSNLERASSTGCKRLVELPESFGNLSNLEQLWLDECEVLQRLPTTFSKLTKLHTLVMQGTALTELPWNFGLLSNLVRAYFTGCKRLVELPESFGNLSNLEELGLDDCEVLQGLPPTFSKLAKLHTLGIRGTALEEFPGDFGLLLNLKTAYFAGCKRLVELPESFGNLSNLEELWLNECEVLQRLPSTFSKLTRLHTLGMQGTALEELSGDFGLLSYLKRAYFSGCSRLVELPESFGNLSNLEELWLDDCEVLQRLPATFSKLSKLHTLVMQGTALEDLPLDFGRLSNLERASLIGCKRLFELPESFGNLSNLEELWLRDCEVLQRLPSTFSKLTKLHTLVMQGTALEELPGDFGQLCNLVSASFIGCKRLVELRESFGNLSNLEELWLDECEVLQRLPATFSKLTKLHTLVL